MTSQISPRSERLIITLVVLAGVFVLLYPSTANWFSTIGFENQKGSYQEAVDDLDEQERQELLEGAREYNQRLPLGPLRDPYMIADDGDVVDLRDDLEDYAAELDFGDGLIGFVQIPSIDVSLPIYHGTDEDTLEKGAGHLHGSALPVGGPSSHSVITAHSGRANANLFTQLEDVEIGDEFFTEVAGERFFYKVDAIDVVDPVYSGDMLQQVEGEDYVTLLTCTPTGVNSHRLLVRGVRVDAPASADPDSEIAAAAYVPDFPWWTLPVAGAPVATWLLLALMDRRRASPDEIRPAEARRATFLEPEPDLVAYAPAPTRGTPRSPSIKDETTC